MVIFTRSVYKLIKRTLTISRSRIRFGGVNHAQWCEGRVSAWNTAHRKVLSLLMISWRRLKRSRRSKKKIVTDFNKSFEALHEKIDDKTAAIENQIKLIEEYMTETDKLKVENGALKNKVEALESRVEELENYSRRNCIEVQGIPEQQGENVVAVVANLGNALGVEITPEMIDACHRVGKKTDEKRPRGIIIKFVRRTDREAVMKKRQQRKRDFSTRHLGLASDTPVYLNDSLSPSRRKLLGRARQIKKEKSFKYLWLRNGNILMRKQEQSAIIEIKCQADLDNL